MLLMGKFGWQRPGSVLAAVLALILTAGCSRRVAVSNNEANGQSDSRDLPFHGSADSGITAEAASRPGVPEQAAASKSIPFNSSGALVVPSGTLLTVRLENTLAISKPDIGKTFQAIVEQPVAIDGRIVIPRDARVKGRVESARVSIPRRGVGYVRLALDSIRIGDKDVALPTSSLFARGIIDTSSDNAAAPASTTPIGAHSAIRLKKGRPLTFRLTAAVDLGRSAEEKAQSGTK